jgi:hypothetical protein
MPECCFSDSRTRALAYPIAQHPQKRRSGTDAERPILSVVCENLHRVLLTPLGRSHRSLVRELFGRNNSMIRDKSLRFEVEEGPGSLARYRLEGALIDRLQ